MNLLLKNTTILENQNPFHKQQVDIEITDGIISKIGKNLTIKDGFEVIGVNEMYPEAKVYFNHKEAILFNVQIRHDFHSIKWIGEGAPEPETLTFLKRYCKANGILIK